MNKVIIPSICAVAGLGLGFAAGFIFAKKKYQKFYEDKVENDILEYIKKNEKKPEEGTVEGHKTTPEEKAEIAKEFPKQQWTDSFKKSQEERKKSRELIRQYEYDSDDVIEVEDAKEMRYKEVNKADYNKLKESFNEELDLYSEFSGVSKSELLQNTVEIIDDTEYYSEDHPEALEELQWSPDYNELRDVDGNVLAPEITLGPEYTDILRKAEETPDSEIYLQDDRLGKYYVLSIESPRHIK